MPRRTPELTGLVLGAAAALALLFAGRSLRGAGTGTGGLLLQQTADGLARTVAERWAVELREPVLLAGAGGRGFTFVPGPAELPEPSAAAPDATLQALLRDAQEALGGGEFVRAEAALAAAAEFAPSAAERGLVWLAGLRLALAVEDAAELRRRFVDERPDLSGAEANGGYPLLLLGVLLGAERAGAFTGAELGQAIEGRCAALVAALPAPRFEAEPELRLSVGTAIVERALAQALGVLPEEWAQALQAARGAEFLGVVGVAPERLREPGPRVVRGTAGALWVGPPGDDGIELRALAPSAVEAWLEQHGGAGLAEGGFQVAAQLEADAVVGPPRALPGAALEFYVGHDDRAGFIAREERRVGGLRRTLLALAALSAFASVATFVALRRQRRLAELQTNFVASVSHELRTPITAIQLIAENLGAGSAAPERVARYAELLDTEARRLGRLVEGVLDLARLERGEGLGIVLEELDGPAFVEGLERDLRERVEEAGFGFEFEARDVPAVVVADGEALRRALLNLTSNAVLHSGGSQVACAILGAGGRLRIELHDDGRGLSNAEAKRLLRPFERGSAGAAKGTGLGLAIARAVALGHGAELTLSRSSRGGLAALIEWPQVPPPRQPETNA